MNRRKFLNVSSIIFAGILTPLGLSCIRQEEVDLYPDIVIGDKYFITLNYTYDKLVYCMKNNYKICLGVRSVDEFDELRLNQFEDFNIWIQEKSPGFPCCILEYKDVEKFTETYCLSDYKTDKEMYEKLIHIHEYWSNYIRIEV